MKKDYICSIKELTGLAPEEILPRIQNRYKALKYDSEYCFYYSIYSEFYGLNKQIESNSQIAQVLDSIVRSLKTSIESKWQLKSPVKPTLKPRWRKLTDDNLSRNSSLVKILYAIGEIEEKPTNFFPDLIGEPVFRFALYPSGKPKKITASKESLLAIKKYTKFLIHFLHKTMGVSQRNLGLIHNLSKDTVRIWIEEVEKWPAYEREVILNEMGRTKRRPNKDVYDLSSSRRVSDVSVPHKLFTNPPDFDESDSLLSSDSETSENTPS